MLRVLLAVPLIAFSTLGFGCAAILVGLLDRSGRRCRRLARVWARLLLRGLGVRVEVTGSGNVPSGPAVYAANHGSALDIPILFGYLPVDFRIIHKRSLYLIPVVGWNLYLAGHVGIDRGNAFRARRSLKAAAGRIHAGTSVAVFPEGTRSPDGSLQEARDGVAALALRTGAPIVPVSIAGSDRVWPRSRRLPRPGGTVTVRVGEPFRLAEVVSDARGDKRAVKSQATTALMRRIAAGLPPRQQGVYAPGADAQEGSEGGPMR